MEKLGALKRVFRNIKVANTTLSNVLFIELIPSVIKELSHLELGEVSQFDGRGSHTDMGESLTDSGETYTTSSTTNTTTNINSYPSNSDSELFPEPDDFPKNANITSKKSTRSKATRKTEEQKHQEYLSTLTLYEGMKAADCVDLFIELHKKIDPLYNRDNARLKWQVDFAKFQKETQRPYEQILEVIKYAFNDEYRSPYLYTPENILNKFEDIVQKMSKTSSKTKYQQERDSALERGNMNTGNRDYTL